MVSCSEHHGIRYAQFANNLIVFSLPLRRQANFAVRYLQDCIERADANPVPLEPSIYHTLVFLLTKYDGPDEAELVSLLQKECDKQADCLPLTEGVDFHYVLRQCQRKGRKRACVLAYLLLGLNQRAIEEALLIPDMDVKV